MANLPEVVQYDTGIYQIETTDPVLGGVNGTTNIPLKNLANRTAYLKKHVDDLESGVTLPPGTATETYVQNELAKLPTKKPVRVATTANITLSGTQTIDGVAVQVGDRVLVKDQTNAAQNGIYVVAASAWTRATDADSAAEVYPNITVEVSEGTLQADTTWRLTNNGSITLGTTLLEFARIGVDLTGYAPLASPAFTGNPTAPTPTQFDNSTKLATTAFAWRQGLHFQNSGGVTLTANTTLTASQAGHWFETQASNLTITLPPLASFPPGMATYTFRAPLAFTLKANGSELIKSASGVSANTLSVASGECVTVVGNGSVYQWCVILGGFGSASFSKSFGASGYQRIPGGLIIQWGLCAPGSVSTFPVTFPNGIYAIVFSNNKSGHVSYSTRTNSNFDCVGSSSGGAEYIAIGW